MLTVPAFVWRGGFLHRAVSTGAAAGIALGALAWLDSGMWLSGLCVMVILGVGLGVVMGRRMDRFWPEAENLDGADRVAVVRAARRGEDVGDPRLATAVSTYRRALYAAAASARPVRWLVPAVLVAALATALWDSAFGSVHDIVVSGVYLVLVLLELFWWPRRLRVLLANADRAVAAASVR